MGRLINPMSQEEFDKMPKRQQWMSNHILLVMGMLIVIFITTVILFGHRSADAITSQNINQDSSHITPSYDDVANLYLKEYQKEHLGNCHLGLSLPIANLRVDEIQKNGIKVFDNLKFDSIMYPILDKENKMIDSFTLSKVDNQWKKTGYNNNNLNKLLIEKRQNFKQKTNTYGIFCLGLGIFSVATDSGKDALLWFISDDKSMGITKDKPTKILELMPNIVFKANEVLSK